jgi:hypothetical protein
MRTLGSYPQQLSRLAGLRNSLDRVLGGIAARAPKARTFVATYPAVVPSSGTGPQLGIDAPRAAAFHPTMAGAEATANEILRRL